MMSQTLELSISELKQFDGTGPSGKLYVAVNGKIFDVTDKGSQFYGKGNKLQVSVYHILHDSVPSTFYFCHTCGAVTVIICTMKSMFVATTPW